MSEKLGETLLTIGASVPVPDKKEPLRRNTAFHPNPFAVFPYEKPLKVQPHHSRLRHVDGGLDIYRAVPACVATLEPPGLLDKPIAI